jgi:F-type H+-transporting ATPase subunit epsilon
MNFITFQLITPERTVLEKELTSLSCPTTMGLITILPNHITLVAELAPGEIHAKSDKEDFYMFVAGGFVEVKKGNRVVILADAAEHHFEIDAKRAEEARTKAQKDLAEKKIGSQDYAQVAAALERSLSRLNLARKHASRRSPRINSEI